MTNPFSWAVAQIAQIPQTHAIRGQRFNPKPAGVILDGSTTDAVLKVLKSYPGRFFTCGELMDRTGRSHSAVSWALLKLRDVHGIVETAPDPRQGNYLRYRFLRERSH